MLFHSKISSALCFSIILLLVALKRYSTVFTPFLNAEDGRYFIQCAMDYGWSSIFFKIPGGYYYFFTQIVVTSLVKFCEIIGTFVPMSLS